MFGGDLGMSLTDRLSERVSVSMNNKGVARTVSARIGRGADAGADGEEPVERIGAAWEDEAMEAAVQTAQIVFAQRTRSRYYYKWRIWREMRLREAEAARMRAALERLEDDNRELREVLEDAERARGRLEDEVREVTSRNRQLQAERDESRAEAEALRDEAAGLRDAAEQLQRGSERLRRENEEFQRWQEQKHRDELRDLQDLLEQRQVEALRLRREREEAEKMVRATALYAKHLEEEAAPPASPKKEAKTKNYPELGLCLSDTLPRPIKKGEKAKKVKRDDGIVVIGVRGPAKQAGILPDDIVRGLNGQDTPFLEDFKKLLKGLPPKQALSIVVEREGVFKTFKVVPNASKEEPGNSFKRLVKIPGEGGVEIDLSRLAAPKGQYYDEEGRLHTLADDDFTTASVSPRGSPVDPALGEPRRQDSFCSLGKKSGAAKPGEKKANMWDIARSNIRKISSSPTLAAPSTPAGEKKKATSSAVAKRRVTSSFDSPPGRRSSASPPPKAAAPDAQEPRMVVGARVVRNKTFWRYGEQDGGAGSLGTVARVDSPVGWVTVRWDATNTGSTYRWGADQAYDVQLADTGRRNSQPESDVSSVA